VTYREVLAVGTGKGEAGEAKLCTASIGESNVIDGTAGCYSLMTKRNSATRQCKLRRLQQDDTVLFTQFPLPIGLSIAVEVPVATAHGRFAVAKFRLD